jgi:hypothetical protein
LFGTEIRQGKTVTWRKHPFVLFQQTAPGWALFVILVFLTWFFLSSGVPLELTSTGVFTVLALMYIGVLGFIIWEWEDWRRDLYCITDVDITDVESRPFGLSYQEKKAEIRNIQDVTTARTRFLNVLLDFGNVDSRVAGNAAPFTFSDVSHPRVVADEIVERIEALKLRTTERVHREQTRSIVDAIIAYHRLVTAERYQDATPAAPPPSAPVPPPVPAPLAPPAPSPDAAAALPPGIPVPAIDAGDVPALPAPPPPLPQNTDDEPDEGDYYE